jgi:hypothetical protein
MSKSTSFIELYSADKLTHEIIKEKKLMHSQSCFNFYLISTGASDRKRNIIGALFNAVCMCQIVWIGIKAFESIGNCTEFCTCKSENESFEFFRVVVRIDKFYFAGVFVVSKADVVVSRTILIPLKWMKISYTFLTGNLLFNVTEWGLIKVGLRSSRTFVNPGAPPG